MEHAYGHHIDDIGAWTHKEDPLVKRTPSAMP
jgi:hypothetical protein